MATMQRGEILIYEGKEYSCHAKLKSILPLEAYFSEKNPRPDELLPFLSTGLRRGYIGIWEVKKGNLFLKAITQPRYEYDEKTRIEKEHRITLPIEKILGEGYSYPVKVTWYSGTLESQEIFPVKEKEGAYLLPAFIFEKGKLKKVHLQSMSARIFGTDEPNQATP